MRPEITLLDLPTELLLTILEILSTEELYKISFLCRGLYLTALPLYLFGMGVELSDDKSTAASVSLESRKSLNQLLPGLCRALFLTSVTSLSIALSGFPDHDRAISDTNTVASLLERLKSVGSVHIDHSKVQFWTDETWHRAFRRLLRSLSHKHCTNLSITDNSPPSYPLQDIEPSFLMEVYPAAPSRLKTFASFKRLLHGKVKSSHFLLPPALTQPCLRSPPPSKKRILLYRL